MFRKYVMSNTEINEIELQMKCNFYVTMNFKTILALRN